MNCTDHDRARWWADGWEKAYRAACWLPKAKNCVAIAARYALARKRENRIACKPVMNTL